MNFTSLLLTAFSLIALVASSSAAPLGTMGFAGEVEVHSVAVSSRKVVFVISGPCELLLAKDEGHAQQVSSKVDHGAVVFYRKGSDFPTDEMWQAECERLRGLTGKGIYF